MDNSLKSIIDSAKEVLILMPANPKFDEVAASLSLYLALSGEKTVNISSSSPMTVEFNRLVGVNKVKTELGNKNLTVTIVDYPAKNIEKVSYDIVNDEFRLLVVPKEGVMAPGEDQIRFSYSGSGADVVIMVGGIKDTEFPDAASNELVNSKKVHIGTQAIVANPELGIMSFARPALSLSELIASLIKETGLKLDADIATNLFAGLSRANGGLANPDVTAETLEIAAHLIRSGARRELPEQPRAGSRFPFPGMIPGMSPKQFEQARAQNIEEVEGEPGVNEPAPKDWLQPKIFTGNKGTSIS